MFGLDPVTDIVAATSDGASVMVRFGNINEFEYIQCLNHRIHLSVVEVLYKQKSENHDEVMNDASVISTSGKLILHFLFQPNIKLDVILDDDTDNDSEEEDEFVGDRPFVLQYDFEATIIKMRQIVKMFKASPKKNEILLKIVKENLNKDVGLILDTKTRWNSLQQAIERFLLLHTCVEAALKDRNIKEPEMWSLHDTLNLKVIFN